MVRARQRSDSVMPSPGRSGTSIPPSARLQPLLEQRIEPVDHLDTVESREYPRVMPRVGRRLPAVHPALGRAILAESPAHEAEILAALRAARDRIAKSAPAPARAVDPRSMPRFVPPASLLLSAGTSPPRRGSDRARSKILPRVDGAARPGGRVRRTRRRIVEA